MKGQGAARSELKVGRTQDYWDRWPESVRQFDEYVLSGVELSMGQWTEKLDLGSEETRLFNCPRYRRGLMESAENEYLRINASRPKSERLVKCIIMGWTVTPHI